MKGVKRNKHTTKKSPHYFFLKALGILAMATVLVGAVAYAYFSLRSPHTPKGVVESGATDYEDTYHDHKEYRGDAGRFQTTNLTTEDSSFEVGMNDSFDSVDLVRRMHYDYYNPGSGDMFSTDESKGFIRPVITTSEAFHGSRSLKIDNRNADGAFIGFNWVRVPTNGKYVFSAYYKSANVGGVVDDNDTCNNTDIFINMQVIDTDFNLYATGTGDFHVTPGSWQRKSVSTATDLEANKFYRMQIRISNTEQPQCFGKGTLYLDAVQFEYAQNQLAPAPSSYVYQTSQQELFAYTSNESNGTSSQYGNIFFAGDQSAMYAHLQVKEEGQLPSSSSPSKLKWWLYDLNGDSNNTATALSSGTIDVSHNAQNFQTQHLNLTQILQSAAPTKEVGVMKMVVELWNNGQSEMYDKEFLNFALLKHSPYRNQDMPNSFFGNHEFLLTSNGAYDRHIIDTPRSPSDVLDLAADLGFHHSREFYLINQENIVQGKDSDPFMDDYVNAMIAHHFDVLPVIPNNVPNQDWQDIVDSVASHYGPRMKEYEVLNEPPPEMPASEYYQYLWRAEEAVHANNANAVVTGPSSTFTMFEDLLSYEAGHGTGYDLFDSFAVHTYPQYTDQGIRITPEQANVPQQYIDWMGLTDDVAPGGVNLKPHWVTEFGRNQSRLYDDIPVITGGIWGQPVIHRPHLSGSVPLGRTLTSSLIRSFYYQMAAGMKRTYYFGMMNSRIYDVGLYGFVDFDGTPMESIAAVSQMTQTLDGSEFVRNINYPELRSNATSASTNRAMLFNVPDLTHPGSTKPLAIVFNWDEAQSGAGLNNVPLATTAVSVRDLEGNPIALSPGSSFSLPLDEAPTYIFGENGTTMAQLATALDTQRPLPASRPSVSVVGNQIKVHWVNNSSSDIMQYSVYRKPSSGGSDVRIATVDADQGAFTDYYDEPTTGLWVYKIAAIEAGTGYEAPSAYSTGISLNLAATIQTINDVTVHERSVINFLIVADDPDSGDTLSFSATGMPSGATLTDHENRTATFAWQPSSSQAGVYHVTVSVTDGDFPVSQMFTITILDGIAGCSPNWVCSEWSVCSANIQYRTCNDQNSCGSDDGRPAESQLCDSEPPSRTTDLHPNS